MMSSRNEDKQGIKGTNDMKKIDYRTERGFHEEELFKLKLAM